MEKKSERVSSTYAEIYFNDSLGDEHTPRPNQDESLEDELRMQTVDDDEWVSPSDTLIGIIELQPPFTSKITRGRTHEGILSIGDGVLRKDYELFLKELNAQLADNNLAWEYILKNELERVKIKVKKLYRQILLEKNEIMSNEMQKFYEKSLQKLEDNLQQEIKHVLISSHANMVTDAKKQIREKMKMEREKLDKLLRRIYIKEVQKIKKYYDLLLIDDVRKQNNLIHSLVVTRNDALKAFYKQMEAKYTVTSMYVMCTERKRCKIKKIFLENIHTTELQAKMKQLKEQKEYLDLMTKNEITMNDVNQKWEERITKIMTMFLRFISFSLKLLPEQTAFLLDFQKMVLVQLNEIQKSHEQAPNILIDTEEPENLFDFFKSAKPEEECTKEPFIVEGDPTDIPPRVFGSSETVPPEFELPYFRLQRQFIYAKCHKFDEVKEFLDSQKCHCHDKPITEERLPSTSSSLDTKDSFEVHEVESESSLEPQLIDTIHRLDECPIKACQDWIKANPFPELKYYLDFTEENFARVKTLATPYGKDITDEILKANEIVNRPLPFSETGEKSYNVATQYSSQDDIIEQQPECPCVKKAENVKWKENIREKEDVFLKRQRSIRDLMQKHPKLLKMFTDECFDFQVSDKIK